jgi:hypothetical protein
MTQSRLLVTISAWRTFDIDQIAARNAQEELKSGSAASGLRDRATINREPGSDIMSLAWIAIAAVESDSRLSR